MDPVRFRDCSCPGTPHEAEGDTVTFRPRLSFDQNVRALRLISAEGQASDAWPVYVFDGPEAWNLVDADGAAVPLTREAIEALDFSEQFEIANLGDTVYGGQVLAPLVSPKKKPSKPSSTGKRSRRPASS